MLVLVATLCMLSFVSCGDDKDEPELPVSTIVNGIDTSLIPGYYKFDGNIAPSFKLYHDGSCKTYSYGTASGGDGTWTYDKESKILVLIMDGCPNHTYLVKSLTDKSISLEWSSVQYGNFTASWERSEIKVEEEFLVAYYKHGSSDKRIRLYLYSDESCYYSTYYRSNQYGTWTYDKKSRKLSLHITEISDRECDYHYSFTVRELNGNMLTLSDEKYPNESIEFSRSTEPYTGYW